MRAEAYAKVNLTLEVLGARPDGYHDLRSVVAPISLCDTLDIELTADGSIVSTAGYQDDLCVKAATVLRKHKAANPSGVKIAVTKRIPVGGGLGGGSADAAAVLRTLNELWQLGKSPEELAAIGVEVGSDVPALVLAQHYQCPVLMEGRGEKVAALRDLSSRLHLLLMCPDVKSSTKEVYSSLFCNVHRGLSPTDAMISALRAGDFAAVAAALWNDLQDPAIRLHPEIAAALASSRETPGVSGVLMSGSGSSVFGLVRDFDIIHKTTVPWCSGRTGVFDTLSPGSNPGGTTTSRWIGSRT